MGLMTWYTAVKHSKQQNANDARPTTWHVRKLNSDEDVVEDQSEMASWMPNISGWCSTWWCQAFPQGDIGIAPDHHHTS
jgi:hypothetical protein